jgi:hypothetical protein
VAQAVQADSARDLGGADPGRAQDQKFGALGSDDELFAGRSVQWGDDHMLGRGALRGQKPQGLLQTFASHPELTRLLISCCAADARPNKIGIRGLDAPVTDSWVTVTGTWIPKGKLGTDVAWPPVLHGTSARQVKQPESPYEKR